MSDQEKLNHAIDFLCTIDSQDEELLEVINDLKSIRLGRKRDVE